ncbi:hypothetical protein CVD28_04520 [Bacillus sp. M6-12]|nr:hypothetical protein CVD28_04520 [Bacillus sp. M6-12]
MIVSFVTDVALLTWKFTVISDTNSYLARTVGIQGGLSGSTPTNYPGGSGAYITRGEMDSIIKGNMDKAGIKNYSYNLSDYSADYGDMIDTELKAEYKWAMLSNWIPGNVTNEIVSKRSVMSEFQFRYDNFRGE